MEFCAEIFVIDGRDKFYDDYKENYSGTYEGAGVFTLVASGDIGVSRGPWGEGGNNARTLVRLLA